MILLTLINDDGNQVDVDVDVLSLELDTPGGAAELAEAVASAMEQLQELSEDVSVDDLVDDVPAVSDVQFEELEDDEE
jgi:hypothetical protein